MKSRTWVSVVGKSPSSVYNIIYDYQADRMFTLTTYKAKRARVQLDITKII